MKFLHISDLHFHKNNKDNTKVIKMLDTLNKKYPNHYLIVTGDITDDGNTKQFINAYIALKPFKDRIFICPGNHDFGAVGNIYSKRRAKNFDKYLTEPLSQDGTFYRDNEPVVNVVSNQNDSVMLIALDSNLETKYPFDFACGKIGKNQLAFLESLLSDPNATKMKKIVIMHHHPFIVKDPTMQLKDSNKLMRILYGRTDVLMFGHKHKSKYWKDTSGIGHILASANSPGTSNMVREISIKAGSILVTDIKL